MAVQGKSSGEKGQEKRKRKQQKEGDEGEADGAQVSGKEKLKPEVKSSREEEEGGEGRGKKVGRKAEDGNGAQEGASKKKKREKGDKSGKKDEGERVNEGEERDKAQKVSSERDGEDGRKANGEKKSKRQQQQTASPVANGHPSQDGSKPSSASNGPSEATPPSGGVKEVLWSSGAQGQGQSQERSVVVRGVGVAQDKVWPQGVSRFDELFPAGVQSDPALPAPVDPRLQAPLSAFAHPSPIQAWVWPVLLPALALRQQQEQQESADHARAKKKPKKKGMKAGQGEEEEQAEQEGAPSLSPSSAPPGARDLIGIAATGSGKTLAFGIPVLQHALDLLAQDGARAWDWPPCALVLSPTRELAQQIAGVLESAGAACSMGCACLFGGAPKAQQKAALRRKPAVVVATPGRLEDLAEEGAVSLREVSFVVLDEADRMLDLGFEPHIRKILGQTKADRRTVMLSATWPSSVAKLAADFLKQPIEVSVNAGPGHGAPSSAAGGPSANRDVKQIVEVVDSRDKDSRLLKLLQDYHKSRKNRVLVFVLYKKEAQRVEDFLQRRGWAVAALHGDKSQSDRTRAVNSFKAGEVPLLVATDVAARGLDIPDVEFVINYSFPLTTEDYVHRIGRTGRAGKVGTAHTFFGQQDKARAGELVNVLREAGQVVPEDLLKFGTTVKKKESKLYGAHFKDITASTAKPTKVTFADSDDE